MNNFAKNQNQVRVMNVLHQKWKRDGSKIAGFAYLALMGSLILTLGLIALVVITVILLVIF